MMLETASYRLPRAPIIFDTTPPGVSVNTFDALRPFGKLYTPSGPHR